MFDAFTKVVAQADARGQFISASEIDALSAMVSDSNKRLDAVNRISSNASTIVASAARQLFAQPRHTHRVGAVRLPAEGWQLAWLALVRRRPFHTRPPPHLFVLSTPLIKPLPPRRALPATRTAGGGPTGARRCRRTCRGATRSGSGRWARATRLETQTTRSTRRRER